MINKQLLIQLTTADIHRSSLYNTWHFLFMWDTEYELCFSVLEYYKN